MQPAQTPNAHVLVVDDETAITDLRLAGFAELAKQYGIRVAGSAKSSVFGLEATCSDPAPKAIRLPRASIAASPLPPARSPLNAPARPRSPRR